MNRGMQLILIAMVVWLLWDKFHEAPPSVGQPTFPEVQLANGVVLKNVVVLGRDVDGYRIRSSRGISKVWSSELPANVDKDFLSVAPPESLPTHMTSALDTSLSLSGSASAQHQ